MSGSVETLGWHALYSRTHASPNRDSMEPLELSGIQNPQLEYSAYTPRSFFVPSSNVLVSPYSNNEPNDSSQIGVPPICLTQLTFLHNKSGLSTYTLMMFMPHSAMFHTRHLMYPHLSKFSREPVDEKMMNMWIMSQGQTPRLFHPNNQT
ncbi:hypothetical protein AAC387_Pa01g3783 [Persea americana]